MASYETTRRWAFEFFGSETPVVQITREQCRAWVDFLRRVPKNAHKRFPKMTLQQAVAAAADRPEIERINAANVNAYLNKFGGALNWAEQEGLIDRNPAAGLRVADPVRKRDKRRPFSQAQLASIFCAPLYTGCVDDWNRYALSGPNVIRRSRFWVPLIGLFTGMRLNEICQLDVADVTLIDGVWCFTIHDAAVGDGDIKRVKTQSSARIVPAHAELLRIGLPAYVASRRNAGDVKLFPELKVGSTGYRSKSFSQWFSRFLVSCGAKEPLTCFHSFRHNFRDGLRSARVGRDISMALGGWATSEANVADAYGNGFPPGVLESAINQVRYDLNLSHL